MQGRSLMLRGRGLAGRRFTELVQFFTEVKGEDPATHQPILVESPVSVPVRARVRMTNTQPNDAEVAGQYLAVDRPEVHVPVGSVDVGPDVLVRVLSSSADGSLVGARYRTRFGPTKGQVTAWRYPVEVLS